MFAETLKKLRAEQNLTQVQFASIFNISSGTIAMWETGKRSPDYETLERLADFFSVTVDYLLGRTKHKTPFVIDPDVNDGYPIPTKIYDANHSEKDTLYHKYRSLDSHGKKMVDFAISEEYSRCTYTKPSTHETIELKLCYMSASAGTGDYLSDDSFEYFTAPRTSLTEQADFAVRVNGTSMEPTYNDGDILLVQSTPYINVGDIGIFVVNGEGYVKEFGKKKLISHNPDYDDIPLTEHDVVICSGLVIGKL